MDQIRLNAVEEMVSSVGRETWDHNIEFIEQIKSLVKQHKVNQHPIIHDMQSCQYPLHVMQTIHMEYREIVNIFTDALLMAQYQSKKVESVMKSGSKAYARFLLTLNTLDEFGFSYKIGELCHFDGSPKKSHLILFEELITSLGISHEDRLAFVPSSATQKLKDYFLAAYDDYPLLLTLLAVAEEIVMIFSPVMRANAGAVGGIVKKGYYQVHGVSSDDENDACDDFHQNDLWLILTQGAGGYERQSLLENTEVFLSLWKNFWSQNFTVENTNARN